MTLRDLEVLEQHLEPSQSYVEIHYGFAYSRSDPHQVVGRVVYALERSDRLSHDVIGRSSVLPWDPDLRIITAYRGHSGLASQAIAPKPLMNRVLYVPPLSIRGPEDLAILAKAPTSPVFLMADRPHNTFMECWQYEGQSISNTSKYIIWIEKTTGVVVSGMCEGPDSDGTDTRLIWVLDHLS
jgi:hypothetical protein